MPEIVPIVEGQTEVGATPVLLGRVLASVNEYEVTIGKTWRVQRYGIVKEGELEGVIKAILINRPQAAGILVLLDADDDCPVELAARLQARGRKVAPSIPVFAVIANRELEAWFLGAKESLRGKRGITMDAVAPDNPEAIRGAKKRLSQNMTAGNRYREVTDAPAFAAAMDLLQARSRCPSFDKFFRVTEQLISELKSRD